MTVTDPPLWMQDGIYPARVDRQLINEVWRSEGVIRGLVVAPGSGFQTTVTGGAGIIQGDNQPAQGKYLVELPSTATFTHDPPPSIGTRVDLIILRVTDPNAGGAGTAQGICELVRGTAGNPGAVPALPPTAIELARVTMLAGMIAMTVLNISSANRPTALTGSSGVGLGAGANSLSTLNAVDGDMRYCTDAQIPVGAPAYDTRFRPNTPGLYVWDSPRWTPPWNMPWGIMGMMQRTNDAGPVGGTEATIAGLSVQFVSVANRRYRVMFEANCFTTAPPNDQWIFCSIVDGATRLSVGNTWISFPGYANSLHTTMVHAPAAGQRDYYIRVAASTSGTIIGRGDAPMTLLVEDIGPNGLPA